MCVNHLFDEEVSVGVSVLLYMLFAFSLKSVTCPGPALPGGELLFQARFPRWALTFCFIAP